MSQTGTETTTPVNKGGPPLGNQNAQKHGLYAKKPSKSGNYQAKSIADREADRAAADAMVAGILEAAGLADDPVARFLGVQMARLESTVCYLERWHQGKGRFSKNVLRPSVNTEITTIDRLLGEIRRLLEVLSAGRAPDHSTYSVKLDGAGKVPVKALGGGKRVG